MKVKGTDRRIEVEGVKLPDSFVAPDHSSMISLQATCQHPQGRDDGILRTVSRDAYKQHPYMQEFDSSISNRLECGSSNPSTSLAQVLRYGLGEKLYSRRRVVEHDAHENGQCGGCKALGLHQFLTMSDS
jgi:hypothetical protein